MDLGRLQRFDYFGSHFTCADKNCCLVESPLGYLNLAGFWLGAPRLADLNMRCKRYSSAGVADLWSFNFVLLAMSRLLTLSKEFKKQTLATIRDKSGRLSGYRISNLHLLAWAFAIYVVIITALKSSTLFNANRSAPCKTSALWQKVSCLAGSTRLRHQIYGKDQGQMAIGWPYQIPCYFTVPFSS